MLNPVNLPNLLVVDDDPVSLFLFEKILGPLNVNLILAQSGPEALLKIKNQEIALALLDIQMPGMNGVTLAGQIQNDKSRGIIPIIFITAEPREESDLEECYDAGAVDFILKPISKKILLGKVRIFLELYTQKQTIQENNLRLEKSSEKLIRLNQQLKESNELNNSLLQTIPFGMSIVDESGIILFRSENLAGEFGEEATGRFCWEVFLDSGKQCSGCPVRKGINVGITGSYEPDGTFGGKIFQISHTGLVYQGKKAMLEIFQDITQRKSAFFDALHRKKIVIFS